MYEGTSQTTLAYGSCTMWYSGNFGSIKTMSPVVLTPGERLPCIEVPSLEYAIQTTITSVAGATNSVTICQYIES